METNEIKKLLYKQNPAALFKYIRKGNAYYQAGIEIDKDNLLDLPIVKLITFEVPVSDMGDADFLSMMPAKLLIRWIVNTEQNDESTVSG